MTEKELHERCVMDRFAGWMVTHIADYFSAQEENPIFRPKIDYVLPDPDYVLDHWKELNDKILTLCPIREYSPELKEIAAQCLPRFLKEWPIYKDEECLKF